MLPCRAPRQFDDSFGHRKGDNRQGRLPQIPNMNLGKTNNFIKISNINGIIYEFERTEKKMSRPYLVVHIRCQSIVIMRVYTQPVHSSRRNLIRQFSFCNKKNKSIPTFPFDGFHFIKQLEWIFFSARASGVNNFEVLMRSRGYQRRR